MSNPNRCGKIARLPKPIREEINQRLERGATARSLVPWLNDLPEVQALVEVEFDGHLVSEHNLSQWRNGGYQDWLRYQEAVAFAEHLHERAGDMKAMEKDRMPMSEVFSLWMTSRLAVSTREIESLKGDAAWRKQRQFCDDLMKMRRAEQRDEQLQLERERLELQRAKAELQRERREIEHSEKQRPSMKGRSQPEAKSKSARPWQDWSAEEKIAGARRPETHRSPKSPTPSPCIIRPCAPDMEPHERAA
ncbi:MAG: hypothetical protein ABJF10_01940 [Chthoniobacter sp.]|uniref:hypothetical protein n=1 Tax=Chthoniobacter sp. TaxID=2510640 RepID=UPI0032A54FAB